MASLNGARAQGHDLTPFLQFALRGVALQSQRLAREIRRHVSIEVFRSFAHDMFTRMISPRKSLLARRRRAQGTALSLGQRPNELWCTDYKGEFLLGNHKYCYPLTVTDHASPSGWFQFYGL